MKSGDQEMCTCLRRVVCPVLWSTSALAGSQACTLHRQRSAQGLQQLMELLKTAAVRPLAVIAGQTHEMVVLSNACGMLTLDSYQ